MDEETKSVLDSEEDFSNAEIDSSVRRSERTPFFEISEHSQQTQDSEMTPHESFQIVTGR